MTSDLYTWFPLFLFPLLIIIFNYAIVTLKKNNNTVQKIMDSNLPESAKRIHQKELEKQTGSLFSKRWFLEYWNGERSVVYAWLTWPVNGGILIKTLLFLESFFNASIQVSNIMETIYILYIPFSLLIVWKCANNSNKYNKFLSRLVILTILFYFVTSRVVMHG